MDGRIELRTEAAQSNQFDLNSDVNRRAVSGLLDKEGKTAKRKPDIGCWVQIVFDCDMHTKPIIDSPRGCVRRTDGENANVFLTRFDTIESLPRIKDRQPEILSPKPPP